MEKVRTAAATGCGDPALVKLLPGPQTVADEVIVYSDGPVVRNILVRSGDRVASVLVTSMAADFFDDAWFDDVVRQTAARLRAG